jgi:hypothetical protein
MSGEGWMRTGAENLFGSWKINQEKGRSWRRNGKKKKKLTETEIVGRTAMRCKIYGCKSKSRNSSYSFQYVDFCFFG